jgi:uncharacterized repeat protein (TIGR04076 family)
MINHRIECEAVQVRTETGVCPGMAKTCQGEIYTIGSRTPASKGMCTNAFNAIYPMSLAMRLTEKMSWEKQDFFDVTCPHGNVTFRLSRVRERNEESSN